MLNGHVFISRELRVRRRAILTSVLVGIALLAVKFIAATLTGSTAILSDALESIINVVASAFAYYSIILSAQPPDSSHPYGHGKIEPFSAGFEGALIILAALAIVWEAIPGFFSPRPLAALDLGILLVLGAAVVNAVLGVYLIRIGQRTHSLALVADGKHLVTDVYTSVGVVVGLGLVWATGWIMLDAIVACAVAVNILVTGARLIRQSVSHLMDEADERVLRDIVEALQKARRPEWIDLHHLRAWRSGNRHHIDFHLTLPRYWNLEQCHATETEIEDLLFAQLEGQGEALLHLDPCTAHHCPTCRVEACPVRASACRTTPPWTVELATGNPPFPMNSFSA
ncbi:MAG TPA: cation diffusion facilitator family transporter [Methylomirabilota bacterium]|jgi:cation diffusion facilitator family transporter|nr:cation diffusion facilitator family transporter [Methylomirabilota bacterium]